MSIFRTVNSYLYDKVTSFERFPGLIIGTPDLNAWKKMDLPEKIKIATWR